MDATPQKSTPRTDAESNGVSPDKKDTNPKAAASGGKLTAFLVGAIIIYATCFFVMGNVSTIPQVRIFYGLFFGSLAAVFAIAAHFLLQVLLRWTLRKCVTLKLKTEVLILNLPVILLSGWLIIYSVYDRRPSAVLGRILGRPVPGSVRNLTFGGGMRNMAEPEQIAFRFEIDQKELQLLIQDCGFSAADPKDPNALPANRIVNVTGIKVDLPEPYLIYVRHPDKGTYSQFIFCSSNSPVVFLYTR